MRSGESVPNKPFTIPDFPISEVISGIAVFPGRIP